MVKSIATIIKVMAISLTWTATATAIGTPSSPGAAKVHNAALSMQEKSHAIDRHAPVLAGNVQVLSKSIKDLERTVAPVTTISQSIILCGHHECWNGKAYLVPNKDICVCQWLPDQLVRMTTTIDQLRISAENCETHLDCGRSLLAAYNPFSAQCVCSVYLFRDQADSGNTFRRPKQTGPKESPEDWTAPVVTHAIMATVSLEQFNQDNAAMISHSANGLYLERRQSTSITDAIPLAPLPTFVPPPQTDINAALIQQSLDIKPQQNAIVHSIIPHFGDGVITFYAQLNGPIPQSLQLNATDSMPCGAVGTQPDPNLILLPRYVNNGQKEIVIPDCVIIAINKVNASWINYWVQKTDGSGAIYSLLGDAQIHDIDQLDATKSAALSIRVGPSTDHTKRAVSGSQASSSLIKRDQVFAVSCDHSCTGDINATIKGSNGFCGCLAAVVTQDTLGPRAIDAPNAYNAIMTAEACASMTCINNGNKSALFNPFSRTCWCTTPTYVEVNESAHTA